MSKSSFKIEHEFGAFFKFVHMFYCEPDWKFNMYRLLYLQKKGVLRPKELGKNTQIEFQWEFDFIFLILFSLNHYFDVMLWS